MLRRKEMEIHPRVSAIDVSGWGGIWLFLVMGKKTAIIDTGPKMPLPIAVNQNRGIDKDVAPVLQFVPPALEKLGMTLGDIDLILNSHIHFDHTAGNSAVKSASNAKIFIHADDATYFEKPELLFQHELAPIIEIVLGKEQINEEMKRYMNEITGPGPYAAVDQRLKDGDIIELGEGCNLEVVHLPGHTQGSVGFYLEEEGILFAGDAMPGISMHDGGLAIIDDIAGYERSLARVQQLPLKVLVHSHPFQSLTILRTTIMRDNEIKQYLEECQEFANKLRQAAKRVAADLTMRPFYELYDEVIGMLPKESCLKRTSEMIRRQFFSAKTLLNYIKQIEK